MMLATEFPERPLAATRRFATEVTEVTERDAILPR